MSLEVVDVHHVVDVVVLQNDGLAPDQGLLTVKSIV
jgi:hypothetical protein